MYIEPIEAGLYEDSNAYERRRSIKMLKVLEAELAPKINRASMLVLKADMPEKKEFVITVPLTPIQHKAYVLYVRSMLERSAFPQTKSGEVNQTTMWHWLSVLSLLCNHPACFKARLDNGKNDARNTLAMLKGNTPAANTEADTEPEAEVRVDADDDLNAPLYKCGVSEDVIAAELRLFEEEAQDITAVELSNKMVLLCQILDAVKSAGDKALVFSGSIETLNYIERLFRIQKRSYNRLDGKTKVSSRQQMTKNFNNDDVDVFLIATRAGGLGLNLQGANRVIIFDFKFNPSHEEQAVGRAYRIGQTKETYVYRFVAGGTFETSVHNKAIYKLQLASRVIDKRTPIAQAKKSLGEFLHEPKDVPQIDLSGSQGKDPLVLDKILAMQGQQSIIREIIPTETFNRDGDERLTAEEEKEVKQLSFESNLRRTNPKKWEELQRKTLAAVLKPSTQALQGRGSFSHMTRVMPQAMPFSYSPYQTHSAQQGAPPSMSNERPPAHLSTSGSIGFDSPTKKRIRAIQSALQETCNLHSSSLSADSPFMRAQEIYEFVQHSPVAFADRDSLLQSALERLKDGSTSYRLLAQQLNVAGFMQSLLDPQRQKISSSGSNAQPDTGKVGSPQTSPSFSGSQQQKSYSLTETVKSPVHNNSLADLSHPASDSQSRPTTEPLPASKYDSWSRAELLAHIRRTFSKEYLDAHDVTLEDVTSLATLCEDWDALMLAQLPPSPVKPNQTNSTPARPTSSAVTPERKTQSPTERLR